VSNIIAISNSSYNSLMGVGNSQYGTFYKKILTRPLAQKIPKLCITKELL